uniref:Uncharacterized protein n=1 Tax=Anguilla anguilla TaxID=7936 RepID=A0A0E9WJS5_ANGAN
MSKHIFHKVLFTKASRHTGKGRFSLKTWKHIAKSAYILSGNQR